MRPCRRPRRRAPPRGYRIAGAAGGGAAANPAVSHIAAQVFDAPVELPEAGEYVAFGAAVQAAWALSGQRPNWQVATLARPTATPEPRIREQYAAHAAV
ncbi:hypothetical protein GCM10025869_07690 [Homoserinibacter gongjuensis]|uniref:Carbohydrate kinase FGGY C-terminal domain-containing protein n=1 Tax=Homoserinibacter gongjuensis TaxID=1162968 RepID=A0ABQ6JPM6_9MICO|nr:hypothetical protein GCM10025869_07690 [Homoserinibacter gongjuensis]